jgi:Domain of unknown function (DUF4417)
MLWHKCESCPFLQICGGWNTECSYCGCTRDCSKCSVRCARRLDAGLWVRDVEGLGFEDLRWTHRPLPDLPRFIPQVDGHRLSAFDEGLSWPAYAVGLRRVFSLSTGKLRRAWQGRTAREVLRAPDGTKLVLAGYGTDPLIERFWTNQHREALFDAVASLGFDLVLAPNYSVYGNQPRFEHLLNIKRNALVAARFWQAGVPAVPNIYWYRHIDLERQLEWIRREQVAAVAVNLQTFRSKADWAMAEEGLRFLAAELPPGSRVFATGCSRAGRIALLRDLFPDLVLVSQNAQAYARHGAVMTREGRKQTHGRTEELFFANVRFYSRLMEGPIPRG